MRRKAGSEDGARQTHQEFEMTGKDSVWLITMALEALERESALVWVFWTRSVDVSSMGIPRNQKQRSWMLPP